MILVSLFVIFILAVSLIAGLKEGAVKHSFNLVATLVAIPIAGLVYTLVARLLSFMPGENWENVLGFFISFAIIIILLHIVFWAPRKLIEKKWKHGLLYRSMGGALNVVNASIGFVVFALVVFAYPIFDWLVQWIDDSSVLTFLVEFFDFVQRLLPEEFEVAATIVPAIL